MRRAWLDFLVLLACTTVIFIAMLMRRDVLRSLVSMETVASLRVRLAEAEVQVKDVRAMVEKMYLEGPPQREAILDNLEALEQRLVSVQEAVDQVKAKVVK